MTKPNNEQKWVISAWSALAFIVISNPFTYKLTNFIFGSISFQFKTLNSNGCPTLFGLLLHTVVFFFLVRIMMEGKLPGTDN